MGAIFRTADAIGVSKIYLTGYTPAPTDRFGNAREDFHKAALGAEKTVLWESYKNPAKLLEKFKKEKIEIVAVEQSPKSIDYKKYKPTPKTALILGNEVGGVPAVILKKCDKVISIPMRGKKESLNVATSAGIVLFRLFDY